MSKKGKTFSIPIRIETDDPDGLLRELMGVDEEGKVRTEVDIPGGAILRFVGKDSDNRRRRNAVQ